MASTLKEMLEYNLSASSRARGGKVATLPRDLPIERLVISHGEILNTCKSQIKHLGRSKTVDKITKPTEIFYQ
jgi:hypothetical protein